MKHTKCEMSLTIENGGHVEDLFRLKVCIVSVLVRRLSQLLRNGSIKLHMQNFEKAILNHNNF